ncbi:toxin [Thiotrichales bacterium HSG1]|nr:toxin [Thiotrichales bacterium HSG1]
MKNFEWNEEKNKWIKENRNISFEEIVLFIENGGLLDTYEHPDKEKYPRQSIFVVKTKLYVYLVPYVEEEKYYFLKTIIPNREAKKKYTEDKND